MKNLLWRRRSSVVAVFTALLVALSGALSTSSAASATLWTFRNHGNGKCLTASSSGSVWVASCNGSSSQRWDWVGPYNNWLKNAATGQCLTTDDLSQRNAVWTTRCSTGYAEDFMYYNNYLVATDYYAYLRTSDSGSSAVYSTGYLSQTPRAYYQWTGSHN
jgi:hypothetical protein